MKEIDAALRRYRSGAGQRETQTDAIEVSWRKLVGFVYLITKRLGKKIEKQKRKGRMRKNIVSCLEESSKLA